MIYLKPVVTGLFALAFTFATMAAEDSNPPTTTTSPGKSRSSTLIHTDVFPDEQSARALNKADAARFKKAYKALRAASARFQGLAASAKKGMTPGLRTDMNAALRAFNSNAIRLAALVGSGKTKVPGSSKSGSAKYDGIDGESSERDILRLVTQVRKLDARIASLADKVSN